MKAPRTFSAQLANSCTQLASTGAQLVTCTRHLCRTPLLVGALLLPNAFLLGGCASAKLEPASADQKVANKPNAAATEVKKNVRLQVEANSWMADDRVKNEVTAMKVTLINRSNSAVNIDYNAFTLVSTDGDVYRPVKPDDIPIRGAARSIGLPADTIITRSSDSSVNAPDREISEKDQIRIRITDQALKSGSVPAGERTVGYIYFERVPASAKGVTFKGTVQDTETGASAQQAELKFQPRHYQ